MDKDNETLTGSWLDTWQDAAEDRADEIAELMREEGNVPCA
jgi:hypothetical protein